MTWTDARTEQLTRYWAEGFSCLEIATRLGGITRNAVIGKVRRLGLPFRDPAQAHNASKSARGPWKANARKHTHTKFNFARKPAPPSSPRAMAEGRHSSSSSPRDETPLHSLLIPLDKLEPRHCRWPIGDPCESGFGFCGHKRQEKIAYCAHHARIAFR